MICRSCGNQLDENAKFCPDCGASVGSSDNTASAEDNTPIASSFLNDDDSEKTVYLPENELSDISENNAPDNQTELIIPDDDISDSAIETVNENNTGRVPSLLAGDTPTMILDETEQPEPVVENNNVISGMNSNEISDVHNDFGSTDNNIAPPPVFPTGGYQQGNNNQFGGNQQFSNIPPQKPVQTPAAQGKSKSETKVGGGRLTGASIITIFAVIFFILLSLICAMKFGLAGNVLGGRIKKLDANTVLSAQYEGEDISTDIFRSLGIRSATHGNADAESFKKFLVEADLIGYIGENVENYADYLLNGEGDDPSLTAKDIRNDFFKQNNDVADDIFGAGFSKSDLNKIEDNLDENNVNEMLSVEEWNDKAGFNLTNLKYILSFITIGILAALVLVLFIWIAVIVDRKGKHLLGFYGNTFFITGLVMFIIGLAVIVGAPVAYTITGNIVFYLCSNVLLVFALLTLGIGAVELLLGLIFKKIKKGIVRKERRAASAQ
ncbi:MAG: zinc-ribbon domain-containing protein [Ruminococcus sp.]|nr:zinc-ribbon domain-containing protein [Ruminococcus sp.]